MTTPIGTTRIGLIVGNGRLPLLIAEQLRQKRHDVHVVAVAHHGETDSELTHYVDEIRWVRLGQFKRILRFLKDRRITEVILAGGIVKPKIWRIRPDALALSMLARLRHLNDDLLLRAIAKEIEKHGFSVRSVTDFMPKLTVSRGLLSRRAPTETEHSDILFGWKIAKQLGALDIGQAVVVRDRAVVAVEAMEGTDAMIRRAGDLAQNGVLVKVAKPQQDHRMDLPTIGPETVETMRRAGLSVLALEAGVTLVLDPKTTLRHADRNHLVVIACDDEEINRKQFP